MSEIETGSFEFETTERPLINHDKNDEIYVSCNASEYYNLQCGVKRFKVKIQYEELKEPNEIMIKRIEVAYRELCKDIKDRNKQFGGGKYKIAADKIMEHDLLFAEMCYLHERRHYGNDDKKTRDRLGLILAIIKGESAKEEFHRDYLSRLNEADAK